MASKPPRSGIPRFLPPDPRVSQPYLLTPKTGKAPHATVVCVPGHGRGVDDIVGVDDKGQDRAAHDLTVNISRIHAYERTALP